MILLLFILRTASAQYRDIVIPVKKITLENLTIKAAELDCTRLELKACRIDFNNLNNKYQRQNTWAWIGKGTVTGIALATILKVFVFK